MFKSKYYEPILGSLRRIFGSPEASEADLDQALEQVQSFSDLEAAAAAKAKEDLEGEVKPQVQALQAQVTTLEAQVQTAQAASGPLQEQITTLEAQVQALQVQLQTAQAAATTAQANADKYAGELAAIKAKAAGSQSPADENLQTPAGVVKQMGGTVVETPLLRKGLGIKGAAN